MSFFTFQADLPHQLAAVNNVAELLAGLDKRAAASFLNVEDIIGNADEWDDLADDLVEENLRRIQNVHNSEQPEASLVGGRLARDDGAMLEGVSVDAHSCPHFSIEMETGTGKTYVYLRTMLELHRRYGFTKFIAVVPSVAILEGVKKAFDDMKDHFKAIFGTTNFARRVYDGSKPGIIPAFARDVFPSLLIMTQQSFNRTSNNLYKANDSVISELKPYQWLQRTRPIVSRRRRRPDWPQTSWRWVFRCIPRTASGSSALTSGSASSRSGSIRSATSTISSSGAAGRATWGATSSPP